MYGVRYAPSPTGRFHVGNLRTAWVSWAIAKHLEEPWIVRFEDIDGPRVLEGARERQLEDLKSLGLIPDKITTQSSHHKRHYDLFEKARASGQVYRCTCSRQEVLDELADIASAPHGEPALYTGKCRQGSAETNHPTVAWRFRNPQDESGQHDFIIARTPNEELSMQNFSPAYHWACAIDDHDGGYKLLVRAWDLASAKTSQKLIHEWVAKVESSRKFVPEVFHTALVVQNDGHRLEKRTKGVTLSELEARGIDSEKLRQIFAKSFKMPDRFSGGEAIKQITVDELGIWF